MVGQHILSGKSSYLFGRLPTCQLLDDFASRCHVALLFRPTGEAYILDNSARGTLINNKRVPKVVSTKLNSGDRFSFDKINRSYLFQVLKPSEEDPSGFSGEDADADVHVPGHPQFPFEIQNFNACGTSVRSYQLQVIENSKWFINTI